MLTCKFYRHAKPDFYLMDIEDEEDFTELAVIKKFDEKMNWYTPFCIQCEKDLKLVDEIYSCC